MTEKDLEDYIVKLLKEVEAIKVKLDRLFDKPSIFDRLEDFKVRLKILESQKSRPFLDFLKPNVVIATFLDLIQLAICLFYSSVEGKALLQEFDIFLLVVLHLALQFGNAVFKSVVSLQKIGALFVPFLPRFFRSPHKLRQLPLHNQPHQWISSLHRRFNVFFIFQKLSYIIHLPALSFI
jgi:hypothetical protein